MFQQVLTQEPHKVDRSNSLYNAFSHGGLLSLMQHSYGDVTGGIYRVTVLTASLCYPNVSMTYIQSYEHKKYMNCFNVLTGIQFLSATRMW